jgi:putative transposase
VRELKQQIELFVQRYNADASPFQWVATADSILQKIERIAKRISATGH